MSHDRNAIQLGFGATGTTPIGRKPGRLIEPDIPTHAAIRAKERYGLDLSFADIRELSHRCAKGEGHTETQRDGRQYHSVIFGEHLLWLVYLPEGPRCTREDGVILTIMPHADAARARGKRDWFQMRRRKGQWSKPKRDFLGALGRRHER